MSSNDSPFSIPYYAPTSKLGRRIPSIADIEDSKSVLSNNFGHKVVIVEPFVVKYGNVDLEEGRTMLFVKEKLGIPVPTIYALFRDDQIQKNFIVMEKIEGTTLQDKWQFLDISQKQAISMQIKEYVSRLRAIPSPGMFCGLGNLPLRDSSLPSRCFDSEPDFNQGLFETCMAYPALRCKASFYKIYMSRIFTGHPPVLTHGDLQRKNIMVGAGNEVTLLDWETAGWYPSYWEYCHSMSACHFQDDWYSWIGRILEPYVNEDLLWQNMTRDMWG